MPDRLFQPGDPAGEPYLIGSGSVDILARSGKRFVHVVQCGLGDILGEMVLIEEWSHFLTARVSTSSRATTQPYTRPPESQPRPQGATNWERSVQGLLDYLIVWRERSLSTDGPYDDCCFPDHLSR
jgi:hypothetical protein